MKNTKVVKLHSKQSIWVFGETEGSVQKTYYRFHWMGTRIRRRYFKATCYK